MSTSDAIAKKSWGEAMKAYLDRRVLIMLFLGFAAGVPILLIFSSLSLWLREAGVDKSTVTMFGWAALGYSFKFIWAPLVDSLPLPILTKVFGRRRSWMLVSQFGVIGALVLMASVNPVEQSVLNYMAFGAVMLGFSSATQDIVIDAYRIELAPPALQPTLSAVYILGYRMGMVIAGAGALYLADFFGSTKEAYSYEAWRNTYYIMAAVMGIAVATTLIVREPVPQVSEDSSKETEHSQSDYVRLVLVFFCSVIGFILTFKLIGSMRPDIDGKVIKFLFNSTRMMSSIVAAFGVGYVLVQVGMVKKEFAYKTWVAPLADFFERYGKKALIVLALIGLYRVSDIVLGAYTNIFYLDMGFTKTDIATAVKVVGMWVSIGGALLGGLLAQRMPIMKVMMLGAVAACITNLLFIVLVSHPGELNYLYFAVILDNLAAGFASAVFVAFLSALTSIRFTAVQYAIFSSLMTLLPKLLSGYSGGIVEQTSDTFFFGITFAIGIPVLVLVWLVDKHFDIGQPQIGDK